jgi:carbamoyl-phosphate synthase small subunit
LKKAALLALADGSLFRGVAIGIEGQITGEVVFNTAMTGYQEILTDPSYAKQIVTLTYPHIGNVGTNSEDEEAAAIHCAGLVIRDLPVLLSNWRSQSSLEDYLKDNNVLGIADIDTRRLTRILREKGAQGGCLIAADTIDEAAALSAAQGFPGLKGMDLAKQVTTTEAYSWQQGSWTLTDGLPPDTSKEELPRHVVAYDFGVKRNILRICRLTVVPAQTPASDVLALEPDGIFLSNGPGDPEPCDYAISAIRELLGSGIPIFGICLGHQLLALASGAKTMKMKFGHHGANHPVQDLASQQVMITSQNHGFANHPVQDLASQQVMITSQNHGFAVDDASLPANLAPTHRSLFDGSLQGVERTDCPAFSFQGHPEASPGPHDVAPLFDRFIGMMEEKG